MAASIGGTLSALAYVSVSASTTLTFPTYPAFTFVLPAGTTFASGTSVYLGQYNSSSSSWSSLAGPGLINGTTVTFPTIPGPAVFSSSVPQIFALFSTAQTLDTTSAFTCPTNDQTLSVARSNSSAGSDATRRIMRQSHKTSSTTTGRLAVTYSTASLAGSRATATSAREQSAGGALVNQLTFAHLGTTIHVLSVPAAQMSTVAATLRSQPGVESVAPTGLRRYPLSASPYFPNDPYFNGFTSTQNGNAGNPAATTFQVPPYEESAVVPGQWDMHAIQLEHAFGYSQTPNGTGGAVAGALGSSTVKIAIIDTGEDPNHPELASKIAYQKCFITNEAGTAQSTSGFETDPDGHGTDVSGIAAADMNNNLGFVGAGGNAEIYAYRVFPAPDDNCTNENTTDAQCSSDTTDIAAAINDAVQQHVNVISMSLGGDQCSPAGTDSDPTEGAAVQNAINAGIIVVAASGNSGGNGVGAPACDTGVIAVGATSLADGTPNGTNDLGTPTSPLEYVTSYTQYGSNNTLRSPNAWGIVAPGGDPNGDSDTDDLHWIENIWTTTPYESSTSDTSFQGECTADYASSSVADCRTLIAGTSMATPHVAGAAALILSATGGLSSPYQSPTAMKALLCTYADDLPGSAAYQGCGRLNVYTAMAHAVNDPSPPTPVP